VPVFDQKNIFFIKNLRLDPDSATPGSGIGSEFGSEFSKTSGSGFGFSEAGAETLPITNSSHEKKTGIK
jgi:hypothetical protein